MCQNTLINTNSFAFFELNRVARLNEGKQSFKSYHHLKFPKGNTGFIFKFNQCQCKHYFPNLNFIGISSTYVFGKSF